MPLADKDWKLNLRSFLWHSSFFALVSNFIDIDTVIPSMLIKAGGTAFHLGLLTAIMLGGSEIFQLVFSSFLSRFRRKKRWLLLGINIRVVTLLSLGALLLHAQDLPGEAVILLIFGLITIFSMSGAFAGISYVDILGKSIR
ncbi:MFS transporter, partial [Myxococcota bacterium]|nr:MFS transporter [Myxococcota bacterium]